MEKRRKERFRLIKGVSLFHREGIGRMTASISKSGLRRRDKLRRQT